MNDTSGKFPARAFLAVISVVVAGLIWLCFMTATDLDGSDRLGATGVILGLWALVFTFICTVEP